MISRNVSIIPIALLLHCLASPAGAALSGEQIHSLFDSANQAFRQANSIVDDPDEARRLYEKAVLNYEKIISEGGSMSDKELLLRILNYSDYAATKESMEEQEPIVVGGGKYDALDIEKDRFEDRVFEDRFETNRF